LANGLEHVETWVFDLDNTLYPRTCDLFAQVDTLITRYMMDVTGMEMAAARRLQKDYYRDHGTTLNGLMLHYDVDPDHYLNSVHDIDYSPVQSHPELVETIHSLPGKKYIFTNADMGHTEAVLRRLGAWTIFDGMFDIRAAGLVPKPEQYAYDRFLEKHNIDPKNAVMFDDLEKNLKVPHLLGMATVQVIAAGEFCHSQVESWELEQKENEDHVHHITDDLLDFLKSLKFNSHVGGQNGDGARCSF